MQLSKSQHDLGDWECLPRYAWFNGYPIRIIEPDEAEILVAGWWHPFAYLFNAGMFDSR